eukprot:127571_1
MDDIFYFSEMTTLNMSEVELNGQASVESVGFRFGEQIFSTSNLVVSPPSDCTPTSKVECPAEMTISSMHPGENDLKINSVTSPHHDTEHIEFEAVKFPFCMRIFVLVLSMFLLVLSASYCMGQLLVVKLNLITNCPEPKTSHDIWQHSYQTYEENDRVMSAESQFGETDDACWTTRKIEINIDRIWQYNKYVPQWKTNINAQCVLFGLLSVFLMLIILFTVITSVIDVNAMRNNTLYMKSSLFVENNTNKQVHTASANKEDISSPSKCQYVQKLKDFHSTYLQLRDNSTGWIVMKICAELPEFVLQSQAGLLYNGYYLLDPNNDNGIYLAHKPEFILVFAVILSLNLFGSALAWLFYSLRPNHCYGSLFANSLFFVDKFSDLLYTLFPFYMIIMDDYNLASADFETNILVLLGQLQTESPLAFLASFLPLCVLSIKCCMIVVSSRKELVQRSFEEWYAKVQPTRAGHHAGYVLDQSQSNLKAIGDVESDQSWIHKSKSNHKVLKQLCLVFVAILFTTYGMAILSYTINHIQTSTKLCDIVSDTQWFSNDEIEILSSNPELYLWDHCLYKVYPFTRSRNKRDSCQCRVLVVDWNDLDSTEENTKRSHLNLTQNFVLNGALSHWYMLEKFHTLGVVDTPQNGFNMTSSVYKSVHMKAFDWRGVFILSIEDGIGAWKELEYLAFVETQWMQHLPADFGQLDSIQYLYFQKTGLLEIEHSICGLNQTRVIHILYEIGIQSVPHCIQELTKLEAIWIDATSLKAVPLSVFNLPHLLELSLFNGDIDVENLMIYNNISLTNTFELQINANATYWLAYNPICNELESLPSNLRSLIDDTCTHPCGSYSIHNYENTLCSPRLLGDGRCTEGCQTDNCNWDHGDCAQLCFAPQLSNCEYELLTNDQCDDECNNAFCSMYNFKQSHLGLVPTDRVFCELNNSSYRIEKGNEQCADSTTEIRGVSDMFYCPLNRSVDSGVEYNFSQTACWSSNSIYMDPNVHDGLYSPCWKGWLGDGVCDDTCRTHECLYDNGDCDEGNGCKQGSNCYNVYQVWNVAIPSGIYKINHSYACSHVWPMAESFVGYNPGDCMTIVQQEDFNGDGYVNMREFIVIVAHFTDSDLWSWRQINCSQCIGAEYYNI